MKRRLSALAVVPLVAALAGAPPAYADPTRTADAAGTAPAASTAGPADIAPQMLKALRRDLGLTADQARRRLAAEAAAPPLEVRLRQRTGAAYAGAWLARDGAGLTVAITDAALAATVRAAGARPVVVSRSARQLDAAKARLDTAAPRAGRQVHGWYVDVVTNSVVVLAPAGAGGAARAFARAAGLRDDAVRVAVSPGAPRPLYDVRGGDAYYPGNARCSIGFSVAGGFVTAGHCGGVGTATSGVNRVAQGTVAGSSFPGNDYAWVRVNASWVPTPYVNNYAGGVVSVAGSQEAAVGSSVCRSGSTTGWRCGTIQARNVTVNYAQGSVSGLVSTNACAEPGDSGGSWISGNQAQGVTSGGSGNCTSGGSTVFQPVNEILGAYGLSLTTTGSGGGGGGRPIVGYANKCIDVPGSNSADGNPLQLYDCNGTAAQSWTFAADGSVRALGKCMDVASGSTANGAVVQLWTCNGTGAQRFVLNGAGDLVNPQANKCIDVAGWNSANGTRLIMWDCHGGANQKWRLG